MSKFNSEPIDIIVPWVNPNDPVWQKDFEYWKQKETGNKDACRYRDWGFIRYVFRSIEENCSWCRYVFLILAGPSQIPDWLNINNPKLKIIYHKDYIPDEFLPTFNSNVIELFYSNIDELSENFILINDDMFFCQKKGEEFFFKNNLPIYKEGFKHFSNQMWDKELQNSRNVVNKILNIHTANMYETFHLPIGYNKSLQNFMLYKIDISFMKHNKFRKNNDLTHFMFYDLACKTNHCKFENSYRGQYIGLKDNVSINFKNPLICVNENEFTKTRDCEKAIKSLSKYFNKKSGFEK